jgi:beta-mannosidase
VDASTLRDHPFLGNSVTYLSGPEAVKRNGPWRAWTASGSPVKRACTYEDSVDFDVESKTGQTTSDRQGPVTSAAACCMACFNTAECAASVFVMDKKQCWLKNASQVVKKVQRPGRVACIKDTADLNASPTLATTTPPVGALVIEATVPGDLISDLENAGQIQDPLHEMNFLNNTLWQDNSWTYSTEFEMEEIGNEEKTSLIVFDGVKMGARVSLNGFLLGIVDDQFLRYRFPIPNALLRWSAKNDTGKTNVLTVAFDKSIRCHGRWMACTGGWDWAPYSHTVQEGATTFSKGIWKSVYIATVDKGSAAISHVVPHVFYKGAYPSKPLHDGQHAGFDVHISIHFWAPQATTGTVDVRGSWSTLALTQEVNIPEGDSMINATISVTASEIELWWPNNVGAGKQTLYGVEASFTPDAFSGGFSQPKKEVFAVTATRKVGFRHFAIVTGPDEDPVYVKNSVGKEGTVNNGMFFRVNGAAIFARGANMIPMEELEGRMRADALKTLVKSAADAGFNILRNWGGGIFYPDAWYDACDEFGIMIYHDMMFAQQGHSPQVSETEELEFRHQARRLSHHPSIVIWDGCNECVVDMNGPTAIYATFLLKTIAEEDRMRSVWPACPAEGWASGVDRLTSRPTGSPLVTHYLYKMETHGPYQHGMCENGWPNQNCGTFNYSDNTSPTYVNNNSVVGTQEKNVFASEFGSVVMSSFESMSPTLEPSHWALHGGEAKVRCETWPCEGSNPMVERNYQCTPLIKKWFGDGNADPAVLNTTGEIPFKRQLYQCMLGQALEMKSNIEHRRSTNVFGIIVWQYNEIWPTGGWGSVEYGTPRPGQVLGGRWKPLHYFYASHLYQDVIAVCGTSEADRGGSCYVKNDRSNIPFKGTLRLDVIKFADQSSKNIRRTLLSKDLTLASGPGVIEYFSVDFSSVDRAREVVSATIMDDERKTVSSHVVSLAYPKDMLLPKANVQASVVPGMRAENGAYTIEVTSKTPALYVVLTTLAHGRFSENAFLLGSNKKIIFFHPFVKEDQEAVLSKTLRVEDLSENM